MHANWPHKINDQINRKRQGLPDAGCQRGATAILLFVCMLSLFSTNCPNIIVLHSANTSELQATKKPHNYHKIAVWQKDDRIRKSPLKFCVYHYNELEGDCQAAIITELCRREKLYLSTCLLIHIKQKSQISTYITATSFYIIKNNIIFSNFSYCLPSQLSMKIRSVFWKRIIQAVINLIKKAGIGFYANSQ